MTSKLTALVALAMTFASLSGCVATGAKVIAPLVGRTFTNASEPKRNAETRELYSRTPQGTKWLYHVEREGDGRRYYIDYIMNVCRYSFYVDSADVIRSWRDEGGDQSIEECAIP
jgi:hypothetical protein